MMTVDEFHNYLSMMWYQYGCADKDQITGIIEEELARASDYNDGDHLKRAVLRRCQSETLMESQTEIAEQKERIKQLKKENRELKKENKKLNSILNDLLYVIGHKGIEIRSKDSDTAW